MTSPTNSNPCTIGFDWVIASPSGSPIGAYNHPFVGYTFSSEVALYDGQKWSQVAYFPYEYIDAITVAPDGVIWTATDDHIFRIESRTLHKINPPWVGTYSPAVSSVAVANDGTAWFGFSVASFLEYPCGSRSEVVDEKGVYRYDGKTWVRFTAEDGLVDNKICAITIDASGIAWFGSFDKGVSRFDGETWKTYMVE
jgi:ligand-binding sensor domain-containing protein